MAAKGLKPGFEQVCDRQVGDKESKQSQPYLSL